MECPRCLSEDSEPSDCRYFDFWKKDPKFGRTVIICIDKQTDVRGQLDKLVQDIMRFSSLKDREFGC